MGQLNSPRIHKKDMVGSGQIERDATSLERHQQQLVGRVTLKGRERAVALIHRHSAIEFNDAHFGTKLCK